MQENKKGVTIPESFTPYCLSVISVKTFVHIIATFENYVLSTSMRRADILTKKFTPNSYFNISVHQPFLTKMVKIALVIKKSSGLFHSSYDKGIFPGIWNTVQTALGK